MLLHIISPAAALSSVYQAFRGVRIRPVPKKPVPRFGMRLVTSNPIMYTTQLTHRLDSVVFSYQGRELWPAGEYWQILSSGTENAGTWLQI